MVNAKKRDERGLVGTAGVEPATFRLGGGRSILLSYVPARVTSSF